MTFVIAVKIYKDVVLVISHKYVPRNKKVRC